MESLVDWNLALVNATPEERQRLLSEKQDHFRKELELSHLTPDDRKLAQQFFDTGVKLANLSPDPDKEAELLEELREALDEQVTQAETKGA